MNIEELRKICVSKKGVEEAFPFNEDVLVFKVMGKMFALTDLSDPVSVNLKCDPDYALELREKHSAIFPGYHMNKKHWNTVMLNSALDDRLIVELITHSYNMVVKSLSRKLQQELSKS